jgi:hypothetical protein
VHIGAHLQTERNAAVIYATLLSELHDAGSFGRPMLLSRRSLFLLVE